MHIYNQRKIMNKNTRIQISEELSKVPKMCTSLVEQKIRRELEMVSCEIEHLIRVSRHDNVAPPESIVWHIEQARKRLFWLDAYMADVHTIASQYMEYVSSQAADAEAAAEKLRSAMEAAGIAPGGSENEEASESTD